MRHTTGHKIIYMAGGYAEGHTTPGLLPRVELSGWIRRVSVNFTEAFYNFSVDCESFR